MTKIDNGEFFEINQENTFAEYKAFRAERYYVAEQARPPLEVTSVDETYQGADTSEKSSISSGIDSRQVRQARERLNDGNVNVAETSAEANVSTMAQSAANTAQLSTTAASGGSASAATATAAATTSATALVIAIVAIVTTLLPFIAGCIGTVCGADFVAITIDMDAVISGDDSFRGLTAENFRIEVLTDKGNKVVPMRNGKRSYLITDLQPSTTYTYNLVCNNTKLSNTSVCYTDTFTTSSDCNPSVVCNESETFFTVDGETQSVTLNYELYLSDYERRLDNSLLLLCSSPQTSPQEYTDVLQIVENDGEDNFFKGICAGITDKTVYMYVVGIVADDQPTIDQGTTRYFIYETELQTNISDEWWLSHVPLIIDDESVSAEYTPTTITVKGKASSFKSGYDFYARVTQYDKEGNPLCENEEAVFNLDEATSTFILESEAYYGVSAYEYTIYTYEGSDEPLVQYESQRTEYTCEQGFAATYTCVEPNQAITEYADGNITVTVNPDFSCEYDNYYYTLALLDEEGREIDKYTGKGNAVFTLTKEQNVSAMNFVYSDYGTFINGQTVLFDERTCTAVAINYPTLQLGETYGWDGEYFTVDLTIDTTYDLTKASVDVKVVTPNGAFTQTVENPTSSQTVTLTEVVGEPQTATIEATLKFKDNQTDQTEHTVTSSQRQYDMYYQFEITSVSADLSTEGSTIPVKISFTATRLPVSYNVVVTEATSNHRGETDTTSGEYSFNTISDQSEGSITVSVTDQNDNVWKAYSYNVSKAKATENFSGNPKINSVNPGESAISYNDDGTINVYRKVNVTTDDPNIYCNARLIAFGAGETMYDCFTNGSYAVAENLPSCGYYYKYYSAIKYDNVMYTYQLIEQPSGSISGSLEATVTVERSDVETIVSIDLSNYCHLNNKVIIDGAEYTFDSYTGDRVNTVTVTLKGNVDVGQVTMQASDYINGYDKYVNNGDIEMKGNRLLTLTCSPNA